MLFWLDFICDNLVHPCNTPAQAAQDGHAVPDEYLFIDNGVSGTGLIRPALERLRDLIALSAIDLVYVHAPTASPAATLTR
jgi:hypothetical protein